MKSISETRQTNEELDTTIKEHHQTILHIRAELDAIKQGDPFDCVVIAHSIENISNIINREIEEWSRR